MMSHLFRNGLVPVFFGLCMITPSLEALVYAGHFKAPQGQVLVIDDKHNLANQSIDLSTRFKHRMDLFRKASLARAIPFLVELDHEDNDRRGISSQNLLHLLQLSDAQKTSSHKPFAFEYYEPRQTCSSAVESLIVQLGNALTDGLPLQYLYYHYKHSKTLDRSLSLEEYDRTWKKNVAMLLGASFHAEGPTIGQFKAYLQGCKATMKKICEKYRSIESVASQMEDDCVSFDEGCLLFEELLKGSPDTELLTLSCAKLVVGCKDPLKAMNLFDQLYVCLQQKTDFNFADFCYFDKTLEMLKKEPSALVFVGLAHARALAHYLKACGATVMSEKTCMGPVAPLLTLMRQDAQELDLLDEATVQSFLEPLLETAAGASVGSGSVRTCNHCNTKKESLSTCSRCKKAFYCDKECQKLAWGKHKGTCRPPNDAKK